MLDREQLQPGTFPARQSGRASLRRWCLRGTGQWSAVLKEGASQVEGTAGMETLNPEAEKEGS